MIKNTILEQRRATKRAMIKRLKRSGLEKTLKKIEELAAEFPYNSEYYSSLEKGLKKLNKNIKVS